MVKQSLMAQKDESNALVPKSFGGDAGVVVHGQAFQMSPYVVFTHPNSKNLYPKIIAAIPDVEEGDPVLVLPEPEAPVALAPFRFLLVHAWQHFSVLNDVGQILKATTDADFAAAANADAKEDKGKPFWNEHIESVICVFGPKGLVPARCTFKTTKVNAVHRAIALLGEIKARPEEWGKRSEAHKATLAMPEAWMWFTNKVSIKKGVGKASGRPYVAANSTQHPTGPDDWAALKAFFADQKCARLCDNVVQQYRDRVSEIKAKIVGG